jgi:hypothetical protein
MLARKRRSAQRRPNRAADRQLLDGPGERWATGPPQLCLDPLSINP